MYAIFGKKSNLVVVFRKNMYFCHMKDQQSALHPLLSNLQKIKDEGIVVLDDIRGLPAGDKPFVSPDYVICIGHRGHIQLMYDDQSDYSERHTVGVIFPNHRLCTVNKTDDYLATLIVVNASVLDDPMLQIINQMRYRYESNPCVKLDTHEYRMITDVVEGMREIKRLELPDSRMLMTRLLEFLLRLLSHYRKCKLNETTANKRVSMQFHSDLAQHFRKHHDQCACQAGNRLQCQLLDSRQDYHRSQNVATYSSRSFHSSHRRYVRLWRTSQFQPLFQARNRLIPY